MGLMSGLGMADRVPVPSAARFRPSTGITEIVGQRSKDLRRNFRTGGCGAVREGIVLSNTEARVRELVRPSTARHRHPRAPRHHPGMDELARPRTSDL